MTSYVYIRSEPQLWTAGFYAPDGQWRPESDHSTPEEAAARVAVLNGGPVAPAPSQGDLAYRYALLCHLFEAAWHHTVPKGLDDVLPVTSPDSRKLANLALEVMSS